MLLTRVVPFLFFVCVHSASGMPAQESSAVQRARKLLSDAGFPKGDGFPRITIFYNTSESHKRIATAIAKMWRDNLGIDSELNTAEWRVYLDKLSRVEYQVARRGWIADQPDPSSFLRIMRSSSGNNNTGWKHKQYDDLLSRAEVESNVPKRMKLLNQAEQILLEEAPIVPIYHYVGHSLYDPEKVKGLYQNPLDIRPLNRVIKGDGTGTLVMDNQADVLTLDPATSRGTPERNVELALFEGLLNLEPQTCRPISGVAEGYEVSDNGRIYTFHLRDCAWSDGRPVKAQDFVYSWKRVLDPKLAADYAYLLYPVKGAQKFNQGSGRPGDVGIQARDEKTLVVELVKPDPSFPYSVALFPLYPVREDLVKRHGRNWTDPKNLIGNGPFLLKEWIKGEHILVERNVRYWDAESVKQEKVRFLPVERRETVLQLYERGELDYLASLPRTRVEEFLKRPDVHVTTLLATYFYSFNLNEKPFDDKRVRRALSLAIDRKLLCDQVLKGGQRPASGLVPPVFQHLGYLGPTRRLY